MIYNIHAGFNNYVKGAEGIIKGVPESRNLVNIIKSRLLDAGHKVNICTDENGKTEIENLQNICNMHNNNPADLNISIHFNAFDGRAHGTEIYVPTDPDILVLRAAKEVAFNISKLYIDNRGIKPTDDLYILRTIKGRKTMLIECCFCDSKVDVIHYNPLTMGKAIADGLIFYDTLYKIMNEIRS